MGRLKDSRGATDRTISVVDLLLGRIARSDRTNFELNIWRVSISRALAAGGAEARHLTF